MSEYTRFIIEKSAKIIGSHLYEIHMEFKNGSKVIFFGYEQEIMINLQNYVVYGITKRMKVLN